MSGQSKNSPSTPPIRSGGSSRWVAPLSCVLRGIPSNSADSSVWHSTRPPCSRTWPTPRDPSLPVPDRITATACRPRSRARLPKNRSIGRDSPASASRSVSSSRPSERIISLPGGSR